MPSDRLVYLALAELQRRYGSDEASTPSTEESLSRFEHRVFSQNGEDGVLCELLRRIGVVSSSFVEFGIETGIEGNCVFLADVMGWSGLFIEPREEAARALKRKYAGNAYVRTKRAFVVPGNVEELFADAGVPVELDVLSIDVDGNDYWILAAVTGYAPRIVVIEYNAHWPLGARWVQPYDPDREWQGTDNYGASLTALRTLGDEKGYRLVHTDLTGTNAFFVRADIEVVLPSSTVVPLRAPNLFLGGIVHPPHPEPAPPIIDLDDRKDPDSSRSVRAGGLARGNPPPEARRSALRAPRVESPPMNVTEIEQRVDDHALWWHSIDLGDGVVTPGHKPTSTLEQELTALQLPDLRGKTVLDIGAWDGYFSFAAERLGASRVVAMDYYTWATDPAAIVWSGSKAPTRPAPSEPWDPVNLPGKAGFDLAREILGSNVESVFQDLLTLDTSVLGEFDVVLFLGVLYHTRFPGEMLERVASLTREVMVLETESFTLAGYNDLALGEFFETNELDDNDSNWWRFTEPALAGMCRSSGFASVSFLEPVHRQPPDERGLTRHRALAHALKPT